MSKEKPKRKVGHPTLYTDEMPQKMLDFFDRPLDRIEDKKDEDGNQTGTKILGPNRCPTFEGFCASIGICRDTLYEWRKVHRQFSDTFSECRQIQRQFMIVHGLSGEYNAGFTKFMLTNISEYKDKSTQTIETGEIAINIDEDDARL